MNMNMNIRSVAPARPFDGRPAWSFLRLAALVASASFFVSLVPSARAADARPPDLMTYQGFLVDANGMPLASSNPANYPVIFRIYDQATGGNRLWSEQQIVTIDKGNFSVLLGEGTEVPGESRPPLSQVFGGVDASDRYLGITVTISGAPTEILPRLRLLPAPYAYLARHANALVNNNGQPLVAAGVGDNLVVAGSLTANQFIGNGAGLTGLDASQITSGTLADARLGGNLARLDQHNTFAQNVQVNGSLRVGNLRESPTTSPGYGSLLLFSGGPDVSQSYDSDNSDPLWIARYNAGNDQTELRINIGDNPLNDLEADRLVIGMSPAGQWRPLQEFHPWGIRLRDRNDGNRYVDWWRHQSGFSFTMHGANAHNSGSREVLYDGDSNWDFYSDLRLKKDIVEAEPMLERALRLPIRRYRWKDEDASAKHKLGVIAQEVQPLFPDLVTESSSREGQESPLMVGYSDFGLIAIKALQELKARQDLQLAELQNRARQQQELINALAQQLADQRAEIESLRGLFASLEQRVRQVVQSTDGTRSETAAQGSTAEATGN
jgi:uncharacterized coiled-coil protein SlyX